MSSESLLDIKVSHNPQTFSQYLQAGGDIYWREPEQFWVVTSYGLAREVLVSDHFTCDRSPYFMNSMPEVDPANIQDFFAVVSKMMVMSDAPAHTARRRICYDGFAQKTLETLQPLVRKTIQEQLANCQHKKSMELVGDLAKVLPATILADFFAIPLEEREQFYVWSNNMTQFFGGYAQKNADAVLANQGASGLRDYFTHLIAKRRLNPENDFLSILLKYQSAFQLTDDEVISQAIMMLVAGQVTTTDQLCNNVFTLLSTENTLATLQSGAVKIEDAIHEFNRLDPAVTFIFRLAKCDTEIQGQTIKRHQAVFISSHAVNRDPRVFHQPHHCDITRKMNKHLSYGFGPHYCIGAKLAQLEMTETLQALLTQFPKLRLDENRAAIRKHHSLAFSGFEQLKLALY